MALYRNRKTGVLVDADQFTTDHVVEYAENQAGSPLGVTISHVTSKPGGNPDHRRLITDYVAQLETADGKIPVKVGNWIVQTQQGRKVFTALEFNKEFVLNIEESKQKPSPIAPTGGTAKKPAQTPEPRETGTDAPQTPPAPKTPGQPGQKQAPEPHEDGTDAKTS